MQNVYAFVVLFSAAAITVACSKGKSLECGEGTIERDHKCVVATARVDSEEVPSAPPSPPPVPATPVIDAPAVPASSWQYQSETDKMRGVTSDFAATISTNSVDIGGPYGQVELRILLRKGPKFGNDVVVSLSKGQVSCAMFDGCTVAVRFDEHKVETFRAVASDSPLHPALFIRNVSGFVARLKTAKSLVMEIPTFTAGTRQFEFDVAGLEWDLYKGKVVRD
ncbi:MAG: hypothetical protein F9K40_01155 [Kofleriaceae bacterium]|nr:MAG: hypothetical protein F9K40_01155 [Kofleriaceae bacterium]MBZ0234423.1 hypothetical protein [Kofleriaceae bacterium]